MGYLDSALRIDLMLTVLAPEVIVYWGQALFSNLTFFYNTF